MKRVLAAVALVLGTAGVFATATPANAAGVCLHADLNVNGTAQVIDQCLPPA